MMKKIDKVTVLSRSDLSFLLLFWNDTSFIIVAPIDKIVVNVSPVSIVKTSSDVDLVRFSLVVSKGLIIIVT